MAWLRYAPAAMYPPQPPGQPHPSAPSNIPHSGYAGQTPAQGFPPATGSPSPGPAPTPQQPTEKRTWELGGLELVVDKLIDFILIFVGLYAATAVQRWQDESRDEQEYVSLLKDFKGEIGANLDQEGSIVKDLGAIEDTEPGSNLGPLQDTFELFFKTLAKDEQIVTCLREDFASTAVVTNSEAVCWFSGNVTVEFDD